MKIFALLTLILSLLSTTSLHSEEKSRPCKGDVEKFCKDAKFGGVIKCLKEHDAELSPECKAKGEEMKAAIKGAKDDCAADAEKFCKDVKKGGGRIIKCLKEHEAQLSEECKAHSHRGGRGGKG